MVEGGWTCARVMTYLIRCLTWLNTLCTSSNTIFPSKGQPKYLNFNLQTCGKSMNNGISCQHWVAGGTDPASTASTNVPHRSLSLTVHTSPLKVQVQSQSIHYANSKQPAVLHLIHSSVHLKARSHHGGMLYPTHVYMHTLCMNNQQTIPTTSADTFQPIPGCISCAEITGRWGYCMHTNM